MRDQSLFPKYWLADFVGRCTVVENPKSNFLQEGFIMNCSIFAFGIASCLATGAFAQAMVEDIKPPFWREFERREVSLIPGDMTQVGVSCMGGYILSAGAISL